MLEVRDKLLDGLHDLSFGEVIFVEDGLQLLEEGIDLGHRATGGFFHYAKGLEAVHIDLLAGNVELFVGFLAGSVRGEIHRWIFHRFKVRRFKVQGCSLALGFRIRRAGIFLHAVGSNKLVADAAEGEHLVFAQLGEEDFAALAEDAGEHTDLAGFLGTDEVALHVARGSQGLLLLKAVDPAVGKRAVAECDVGKACGSDLELVVVGHHQIFHNALAGSHDVHRIGGLVGGDAEEVLGGIDRQQVHQPLGLDVVVLDECLHAVAILLAAHVLVGGKVGHDVEAFLLAEDALKDRVGEVEGIAAELVGDVEAFGGAHVAHQLR